MIRVLVTGGAKIGKAGVATIVYKWGQALDSNKVVFDYLMQSGKPSDKYVKKIEKKGGIVHVPTKKLGVIATLQWISDIIKEYKYETIHINTDSAYIAAAYIFAAKMGNIKRIIVHSHCSQIDDVQLIRRNIKIFIHKICVPYVCKNSDIFLACSKLAGEWMFGQKHVSSDRFQIIYNGVDIRTFKFDYLVREKLRKNLDISDEFVIGHIGRLSFQKNQEFLIKVFSRIHNIIPNSILYIVGEGELKDSLINQVNTLCLNDSVRFLGIRDDIDKILSVFDCLVMPSRFEGLPVTMVEAQMEKLPCIVSTNIAREANFTGLVKYLPCDENMLKEWVSSILEVISFQRNSYEYDFESSCFNIYNSVKKLEYIFSK